MFSSQSRLRHAVADTFAMVVYCSVVNMLIEIFLSGMTFEQSLSSRLVAIPVNIIIAWPYGLYRDAIMRYARRISPKSGMRTLADVVAWLRAYRGVTEWSDEQRVRRTGSKRCSNARARALGWAPEYPSYKEGYAAILAGKA